MNPMFGRRTEMARLRCERGSALVLTALMLVLLLGASAFVLDYGVMWLARRQAQNAADAGALAGAIARAYDDAGNPPADGGVAWTAANEAAAANLVWGKVPGIVISWDCPSFVAIAGRCAQVDVYRDGTNGSETLPSYFGNVLQKAAPRVKATATAQAVQANATDCLRPWAIPDLWQENQPNDPIMSTEYNEYQTSGKYKGQLYQAPIVPDVYSYPGYTVDGYLGTPITMKNGSGGDTISPGWYMAVDVPRLDGTATGANAYRADIYTCNGAAIKLGTYLPTETGNMSGPTTQGVKALIAQDPNATYNPLTKTIEHSCIETGTCTQCDLAGNCGIPNPGATISPRVVAIAAYDPHDYQYRSTNGITTPCTGGGQCVKIVNIFGLFVDHVDSGGSVIGYLISKEGVYTEDDGWTVDPSANFTWAIRLVR